MSRLFTASMMMIIMVSFSFAQMGGFEQGKFYIGPSLNYSIFSLFERDADEDDAFPLAFVVAGEYAVKDKMGICLEISYDSTPDWGTMFGFAGLISAHPMPNKQFDPYISVGIREIFAEDLLTWYDLQAGFRISVSPNLALKFGVGIPYYLLRAGVDFSF